MMKKVECVRLAILIGCEGEFDPWEDANHDYLILKYYKGQPASVWSDYKDALYHERKGHGTHNVWEYYKGKFAMAAIMYLNR